MHAGGRRRPQKVSEYVARQIVRDILAAGLEPGAMLPAEAVLVGQYQVGRGSLREALRLLEVMGVITIKSGPGGGPVVAKVTSAEFGRSVTFYYHVLGITVRELLTARRMLEPMLVRLAAEQRDPKAMEQLLHVAEVNRTMSSRSDMWLASEFAFHAALIGSTGNPIVDLFAQSTEEIYADRITSESQQDAYERLDAQHQEIATAILNGEADQAEKLMRAHLEESISYATKRYPSLLDEVVDWR
jgi:GntR family transcriptional regulator, transcriptional repressor for pyruvate dehydrogenase complex